LNPFSVDQNFAAILAEILKNEHAGGRSDKQMFPVNVAGVFSVTLQSFVGSDTVPGNRQEYFHNALFGSVMNGLYQD